jgi:hypothetical protein
MTVPMPRAKDPSRNNQAFVDMRKELGVRVKSKGNPHGNIIIDAPERKASETARAKLPPMRLALRGATRRNSSANPLGPMGVKAMSAAAAKPTRIEIVRTR